MVFYVTPWEYLDLLTHNLKAAGSNPAPATNHTPLPKRSGGFYVWAGLGYLSHISLY
jgi:hypothetical protein